MALVSFLVQWEWTVDPGSGAVKGIGPRQLAFWDCGFDYHRGMDPCLWLMLFCQVEFYGTEQTLVHMSPTECGVSICELSLNLNSEVTSDRVGFFQKKSERFAQYKTQWTYYHDKQRKTN
jgi:hypothetical protein